MYQTNLHLIHNVNHERFRYYPGLIPNYQRSIKTSISKLLQRVFIYVNDSDKVIKPKAGKLKLNRMFFLICLLRASQVAVV